MDAYRIKVKIGEYEFEAEGPADLVQSQFEAFKELIASTLRHPHVNTLKLGNQAGSTERISENDGSLLMNKILRIDGRVISLTVRPTSEAEAALLVLFGQKTSRNNETVTASELRDGLEHSGYRFARVDRLMQPLCDEGLVIKIGTRKATRYRLTNPGLARAMEIAEAAIAGVS